MHMPTRRGSSAPAGHAGGGADCGHGVLQRARGAGFLRVKSRGGRTCLDTLYQEGCWKMRVPTTHGAALEAVVINTAGGLTGGDEVQWRAEAAAGTKLVLTTQACERIYRSAGEDARVSVSLRVGVAGHIDWLPQETILFEGSRLDRRFEAHLEEGATLTAVESVLLGRQAMGEAARSARFRDSWRIFMGGRLVHAEENRLTGDDFEHDGLSILSGHSAFATLLAITPQAEEKLDELRALIDPETCAAASAVGQRLILRALAPSGPAPHPHTGHCNAFRRRVIAPPLDHMNGTVA
jgi:urease accessory protein